jgi:hypothetical protein
MEAVIFTLIGMRKERFVTEPAGFRPFDWRVLSHAYNSKDNSASRPSDRKKNARTRA